MCKNRENRERGSDRDLVGDGWNGERRLWLERDEKKGQVRRPDEKGLVTTYGAGEQAQRAQVDGYKEKRNEAN